ncbi:alpha/beta hydrolase [Actinomadura miaoliensis]|uniref:Poly(ethylene terephthalate) hydrolase n=1 Tax=Actinomadura miaoliensis TaxID=430685 RepID=A0ABP7VCC9_9ACTN
MRKSLRAIAVIAALVTGAMYAPAAQSAVSSAANPYQRGPAPTEASLKAERGPFQVAQKKVSAFSHPGIREGTIYYPTDTAQGPFGGIAVIPGFVSPELTVSWYGPRLASEGFVVMTLETTTGLDLPEARAAQLLAALDYLKKDTTVKDRLDPSRLAVMGWSMGGGGTLRAARQMPALKAAVPLAPWDVGVDFGDISVPTFLIGADNDFIAGTGAHAEPFYESIRNAEKAYLELENCGHFCFTVENETIAEYTIAWMKRWVDNDTRYNEILCPGPPGNSSAVQEYRSTCPF